MKSAKNIWATLLVGVDRRSTRLTPPNQSPSISAVPINASGKASHATSSLAAGPHTISSTCANVANYSPCLASSSINPVI